MLTWGWACALFRWSGIYEVPLPAGKGFAIYRVQVEAVAEASPVCERRPKDLWAVWRTAQRRWCAGRSQCCIGCGRVDTEAGSLRLSFFLAWQVGQLHGSRTFRYYSWYDAQVTYSFFIIDRGTHYFGLGLNRGTLALFGLEKQIVVQGGTHNQQLMEFINTSGFRLSNVERFVKKKSHCTRKEIDVACQV